MVLRQHLASSTWLLWNYGVLENVFCHLGLWAGCPRGLLHGGVVGGGCWGVLMLAAE